MNNILSIGIIIIALILFNPFEKQEHFTPSGEKLKLIRKFAKMFREREKLLYPK